MGLIENDVDTEMVQQEIANMIGEHDATGNTQAIMVVYWGKLVAKAYGPDTDATTTLISWSMAKSITHALVGWPSATGCLIPQLLRQTHSQQIPGWRIWRDSNP